MTLPALRLIEQTDRPGAGAPVAVRELSVAFWPEPGARPPQPVDRARRVRRDRRPLGLRQEHLAARDHGTGPDRRRRHRRRPRRRRLVFQEPRLLPWASVRDNVAVGAPAGLDRAERDRLIDARLAEVGLADKSEEWPAALSGGQRQRVALARALISRPRLLALDEPLGALDALTRIEMQALVESVWAGEGFSTLLVTHDVAEAVALADRVVVLEIGQDRARPADRRPPPAPPRRRRAGGAGGRHSRSAARALNRLR
ncbi:MAG: ATP-binding cassette domain-containing protein [Sphingomonas sp.]